MTNLEEFLQDFKETGEGEYHFALEELEDYDNKQDHQEKIVVPAIKKVDIEDEVLPALFNVLKYPGDY